MKYSVVYIVAIGTLDNIDAGINQGTDVDTLAIFLQMFSP